MPSVPALHFDLVSVGTGVRRAGFATPWRRLPTALVESPAEGSWRCELDRGRVLRAGDGAVLMLPPDTHHRLVAETGGTMRSWWVLFQAETVPGVPLLQGPALLRVLDPHAGADLRRHLRRLSETASLDLRRVVRAHAAASELLAALFDAVPEAVPPVEGPAAARLRPVLTHIEEHLDQPLGRAGLARIAGLSPTRFHDVFAGAIGLSPMAWVLRRRLFRSRLLLLTTDLPAHAIAERCGFGSPAHFSRSFRAAFRTTASAFRRDAHPEAGGPR